MSIENPSSIHSGWLRLSHLCNATAFIILMMSGWRIYDASPLFAFRIPPDIVLGDWLGGALLWHFFAMWVLTANGIAYLLVNLFSGRLQRRFLPLTPQGVAVEMLAALRGRLGHQDPRHYNQVQKLAYLSVMLDLIVLVMSGLVLWKSVQFPVLRDLLGGYEQARRIHFLAMAFAALFLTVHLLMTLLYPRTLRAMLRGH